MDYSILVNTLFKDMGGLDYAKVDIGGFLCREGPSKHEEELKLDGKENSSINSVGHIEKFHSHPLVSYERRLLMNFFFLHYIS